MDEAVGGVIDANMDHNEVILKRHQDAVARGESFYQDPASGLWVMTSFALTRRGACCGSGCRHCPYPPSGDIQPTSMESS